jgi:hypothetical protein
MGHNNGVLRFQILSMSQSDVWADAVLEWTLQRIYRARQEPQTCLCTHHPIVEVCCIENHVTGCDTEVGNVCVQNFMNQSQSGAMFRSVNRARNKDDASLDTEVIQMAHRLGHIGDEERKFYLDTQKKRSKSLTPRQHAWRMAINKKILDKIVL